MTIVPGRLWQDMTTVDFAALDRERTVAVMPVAAIEQHGPHLPLAVDALIGAAIVERAFGMLPEDLPSILLPMMPVGLSPEHVGFPGTLTLEPETLMRLWTDIGRSVDRAGVSKLVIFNSHGGNPPVMEIVARALRVELSMVVAFASWPDFGLPDGLFPDDEIRHGIHGGAIETSMMMHLRPDLVRREKAMEFRSRAPEMERGWQRLSVCGKVGFGWLTEDLNAAGAVGDATLADADKGRRLVDHAAHGLAELLADVSRLPLAPTGAGNRR